MDKKAFSLFVEAENLPFWVNRPVLRKRMRRLYNYIKKLEAKLIAKAGRIKELDRTIEQLRAQKTNIIRQLEQRIEELELALEKVDSVISACGYKCGSGRKIIERARKGGE